MKKRINLLIFISLGLYIFTGCIPSQELKKSEINDQISVYSFSGSNDDLEVNNGLIILTPKIDVFEGGNITWLKDVNNNIASYSYKFYIFDGKSKELIKSHVFTNEKNESPMYIPNRYDLGSGVGEPDFIDPDLHIFIESGLFLILEITYMDGSSIDYEINLDVKKIQLKPDSL